VARCNKKPLLTLLKQSYLTNFTIALPVAFCAVFVFTGNNIFKAVPACEMENDAL